MSSRLNSGKVGAFEGLLTAINSSPRQYRSLGVVLVGSEARDLLAPVYGVFTQGFETRDLTEAKASRLTRLISRG